MEHAEDEQALIAASQAGDMDAFTVLVTRYQRMIHDLTFRMSGSEADASDLAQDTFVRAWQRLDGFRHESRFSSWLYRIALNACLNWKARRAREQEVVEGWAEQSSGGEPDAADHNCRLVREALLRLPPEQRAALILTTYDEMSHAEAAQALGCAEATVSWRVFAARGKLKRWLRSVTTNEAKT